MTHSVLLSAVLVLAGLASPEPPTSAKGIAWDAAFAPALERAKAESKVVFVAVNMDGEAANERMVKDVYRDKAILKLADATVNLVASADRHSRSGSCDRFGCESCDAHIETDIDVRREIFEADPTVSVIAPQHVFLAPDGAVLLSVPYEVSALELAWCFGEAFRLANVTDPPKTPSGARAPRRLVVGGVAKPGKGGLAPLTKDAVLELIAELKKGQESEDRRAMLEHLATADEPEARDYVLSALRASAEAWRNPEEDRARLLRWIGTASPKSYHELVSQFLDGGVEATRNEAIVALEQLGSEEALKPLVSSYQKVKDETLEKNLLRAIGACGTEDKKARSLLLKASNDVRKPLARQNALIALGWLVPGEDVAARLREAALPEEFAQKSKIGPDRVTDLEREAAVVAMGITRNPDWTALLTRIAEDEAAAETLREAARRSLGVVGGAPYERLREPMMRAGSDTIPRDRLFPEVIVRERR